ncbi:hypothetical protein SKAU_G00147320 [Synaphobranchus kaupii]|uniref:Uncharacterized protein n=1 Tax=Synaphobranchus kaupii TaxID=118154 RepID=A0A9Q1J4K3_SYNKA|nr:hypothetical protein SKAU_G00147320 [Synaphobranchus kaupii]
MSALPFTGTGRTAASGSRGNALTQWGRLFSDPRSSKGAFRTPRRRSPMIDGGSSEFRGFITPGPNCADLVLTLETASISPPSARIIVPPSQREPRETGTERDARDEKRSKMGSRRGSTTALFTSRPAATGNRLFPDPL